MLSRVGQIGDDVAEPVDPHDLPFPAPQVEGERHLDLRRASQVGQGRAGFKLDRKSTRLNSSHVKISYAVFCLKKKKTPALKTARAIHSKVCRQRLDAFGPHMIHIG